jgi:hypothetical protein
LRAIGCQADYEKNGNTTGILSFSPFKFTPTEGLRSITSGGIPRDMKIWHPPSFFLEK